MVRGKNRRRAAWWTCARGPAARCRSWSEMSRTAGVCLRLDKGIHDGEVKAPCGEKDALHVIESRGLT